MLRLAATIVALIAATVAGAHAVTPYKVGDAVPANLSFTGSDGKTHTMGEYRGHPLVLEWTNYGCPFTQKHYFSGNMQKLQKTYTAKGVAWVSVISSAPGKQGYLTQAGAPAAVKRMGFAGTAVALDPHGTLGLAFGAQTTPDMVIINGEGKLAYRGAIDSIPSFSQDDIAKADNYVADALNALLAGKPVAVPQTEPYGCSIKY